MTAVMCPEHRMPTAECENVAPLEPPRRGTLRGLAAHALIWLAVAGFWTCVWFGLGQPALDAIRNR